MKFKIFGAFIILAVLVTWAGGWMVSTEDHASTSRDPANTIAPQDYENWSACDKQEYVWKEIERSQHKSLPDFEGFGVIELLKMSFQEIVKKANHKSDFSPSGWTKYLHARGSVAKVKIEPVSKAFSGIFQGADCGLLRLSLTYATSGSRPVAPGLALKVFRDQAHSANISALVSLYGQGKDFNFFQNPMSNIVPMGDEFGQKRVHAIFKKVTNYPEELVVQEMATIDTHGKSTDNVAVPRQLFFVPGPGLKFSSDKHDVRTDFQQIPQGTVVYKLYAVADSNFDYAKDYTQDKMAGFLNNSVHIANIVLTSPFVSSEFGDSGLFFRHEIRPLKTAEAKKY